MAGLFSGEPSHHGATESTHKAQENSGEGGGRWYLSRKEIEENSPSRRDGIDLKKEAYLRKSYCTFLQDLGMRLKVPQVTIATSIIFCHRFFLRQSHGKNDRRTIATVCMFLAGKVEETPRPLKDVILVSYEIIHKKDPAAVQRIKQKEVYEQQKELVLLGERVVLATLGFDLNVLHPYKPLVEAIKKFRVAQNALAQVAWNFVNDGLRTSLCLQFKPHHIAAGAIFLAAKFLKIKLPSDGEKVWWQEFDVTPRQLEEVSNQMLELYEQNRVPQAQNSEAEGSVVIGGQRPPSKGPDNEDHIASHSSSHGATTSKPSSSKPDPDQTRTAEDHVGSSRINQPRIDDNGNPEINNSPTDYDNKGDEINDRHHREREAMHRHRNTGEKFKGHSEDEHEIETDESRENSEVKDKHQMRILSSKDSALGQSPQDAKKKLDTEKIKAAFVRRKALGDISRKTDPVDDIERELEDVEVPGSSEKGKPEKKQNWSKSSNRTEQENSHHVKSQYSHGDDFDAVEEGELEPFNDAERVNPKSGMHKRKLEDGDGKQRASESVQKAPKLSHNSAYPGELPEDRNGLARHGYSERDYKRQQQLQENHV